MFRLLRIVLVLFLITSVFAAVVPTAYATDNCGTHVVQRGETLFRIALRYGVNMYALAGANGIPNINRIYAGQVLRIPCDGSAAPTTYNPPTYNRPTYNSSTYNPYYRPFTYNNYYNRPYSNTPNDGYSPYGFSCSGFRATSPTSFPNGNITFYWDPPAQGVTSYQVQIYNAVGRLVRSYSTSAPSYSLSGDVGLGAIGPGINFSYVAIATGSNGQTCRSKTIRVQREWTGTVDPAS